MFTLVSRGKGEEGRARMVGGWETKGGGSLAKPKARLPVVCTKMKGSFKELNQITTSPYVLFPQPLQGKHFTATHRGGQVTPPRSKDETPPPSLTAHTPALLASAPSAQPSTTWGFSSNHPSLTSLLTFAPAKEQFDCIADRIFS